MEKTTTQTHGYEAPQVNHVGTIADLTGGLNIFSSQQDGAWCWGGSNPSRP